MIPFLKSQRLNHNRLSLEDSLPIETAVLLKTKSRFPTGLGKLFQGSVKESSEFPTVPTGTTTIFSYFQVLLKAIPKGVHF